jgi:hypothetical protein
MKVKHIISLSRARPSYANLFRRIKRRGIHLRECNNGMHQVSRRGKSDNDNIGLTLTYA